MDYVDLEIFTCCHGLNYLRSPSITAPTSLVLVIQLMELLPPGRRRELPGSRSPGSTSNFYGRYEFTKSFQPIDTDEIVQELLSRSELAPETA